MKFFIEHCEEGNLEAIKAMGDKVLEENIPDGFATACHWGFMDIAIYLMTKYGNRKIYECAYECACRCNRAELLEALMSKEDSIDFSYFDVVEQGLDIAVHNDAPDVVEILLSVPEMNHYPWALLDKAVEWGKIQDRIDVSN